MYNSVVTIATNIKSYTVRVHLHGLQIGRLPEHRGHDALTKQVAPIESERIAKDDAIGVFHCSGQSGSHMPPLTVGTRAGND